MASRSFAVTVAIALVALPLWAQRDFVEEYDPSAQVTLTGRVISLDLTSPNSLVQIEVSRGRGRAEIWTLHGDNPAQLAATGLTRQTLRTGDRISVCGYLPKPPRENVDPEVPPVPPRRMAAEQITIPDGRKFNFASDGPGLCLDPIVPPNVLNRYTRVPGTDFVTEALPHVPNVEPTEPVPDSPAVRDVPEAAPPSVESPVEPRMQSAYPASVPSVADQQRIPHDPQESGYLELYDRQKPVSLTGKITRIDWAEPNTYILLNVNGVDWAIETSFIQLRQSLVFPPIRVGDEIRIDAYLPKERPIQPLPGSYYPGTSVFLRSNRLARAGRIFVSGFVLNMGIPPSDEEIARRTWCASVGCNPSNYPSSYPSSNYPTIYPTYPLK